MELKLYQVDAFTNKQFYGNPAAVCPLDKWLPDETMHNIANENNLSETAFYVKKNDKYEIRWFTPEVEVDLCGHATLATSHVLFEHENYKDDVIILDSKSGPLSVKKENDFLILNFPTDKIEKADTPIEHIKGFGKKPIETYKGISDYLLVFPDQADIENLNPDFSILSKAEPRGIITTAKGKSVDFVSRFFAPQIGIPEDPVTGSAHTTLTPYWAGKLGKTELTAMQLSKRKGWLKCKLLGDRVEIAGRATTYMIGKIYID
jgi:PhzF family phenazine biosynthesis protein